MTPKETTNIPLDTGWETPADESPMIAQIEGVGKVFRRNTARNSELSFEIQGETGQTITMSYGMILQAERAVRVISFLDEQTGLIGYTSLDTLPEGFHPSDFPKQTIAQLSNTDRATVEKELLTVLKKGASKPFFNLDEKIREKGGDPNYRVPKSQQGGWMFSKKSR